MPKADAAQELATPETNTADTPPADDGPSMADAIRASLEETPPAAQPEAEPAEAAGDAEPKPVDSEGTPVEPPAEGDPPAPAEEPPAVEPPAAKKDLLEELGPLPDNASQKTKERFEKLTTGYKDVTRERDEAMQELEKARHIADGWADAVARTNADVQQVANMFRYLEGRNSPTPEGRRQAYELLKTELVALAKEIGEEAPGVDPLEGHPDLRAAVENLQIDEQHARELAKARTAQKFGQERYTAQQQETHAQAVANSAVMSIRQYAGAKQRENQAEFEAKRPAVEAYVQRIMQDPSITPTQWPGLVAAYYETAPMPQVAAAPPPPPRVPNPVRATGVGAGKSTGLSQEPGSIKEAIQMSLRQSARS